MASGVFGVTVDWPEDKATNTMRQACTDILQAEVES